MLKRQFKFKTVRGIFLVVTSFAIAASKVVPLAEQPFAKLFRKHVGHWEPIFVSPHF